MDQERVFVLVKALLVERFGLEEADIQPDASLEDDLDMDSMDAVDLLLAANEQFKIRISEESLEKIKTVSDLVQAVQACRPR